MPSRMALSSLVTRSLLRRVPPVDCSDTRASHTIYERAPVLTSLVHLHARRVSSRMREVVEQLVALPAADLDADASARR